MTDRKVLLVTGASRGIGAAVAIRAAAAGYDVAINYLSSRDRAREVAQAAAEHGVRAEVIRGDVGREPDVIRLFEGVDDAFGRLDALVNNAGILGRPMALESTDAAALERMLALNIGGYFLCLREAARRMIAAGNGGAVVNLASRLSVLGGAGGFTAYGATKGAIDTLTLGAARELAPHGIRINAVSPGVIDTEIHASAGVPERVAQLGPQIPLGRAGTAEEIAETVLWLLSEGASYVTGAVLPASGGR